MNLIYFVAFALILLLIGQLFRLMVRRWTGYDVRADVDEFNGFGMRVGTDWARRGLAEKREQAEADLARKTRKGKEKAYYETTSYGMEDADMLTDQDYDLSRLETGYDGSTEIIPIGELLEDQQRRNQS